jgi:hypothetical protein
MKDTERSAVRALFKTVVLGIQYGLGARSLAVRAGISLSEAYEILARLGARFHRFWDCAHSVLDHAGLHLEIGTPFGWYMQCPPNIITRRSTAFQQDYPPNRTTRRARDISPRAPGPGSSASPPHTFVAILADRSCLQASSRIAPRHAR